MKSAAKPVKENDHQVVLLRVGIDTGSGGMLGPIFDNGTFEFIPIVGSRDCLGRTYGNTMGRHGRKLIDYFPGASKVKMQDAPLHFDPEFKSYTYGDPTRPKQSLKKLKRGDLLVFYAGLKGWGNCKTPPGLYIVGYFFVKDAGIYHDLKRDGRLKPFTKNWHILNEDGKKRSDRLILVKGGKRSRLLKKGIKISADERPPDRGGHPVFVLDHKMKKHFGNFTKLNAIQRSTPRWVKPEFCDKAAAFITALK